MNHLWGYERGTRKPIYLPDAVLDRHLHLVGFTGTGKTTALITLLLSTFCNPYRKRCTIVIDRLGGFSLDLLRWFASSAPAWVRQRLIYIEAANENITIPFNPLRYATPGEGYYRTARAAEIALRGWDSQDLTQMPRLMRWIFNSMWAVAQLGLAVADAAHLLFPRSPLHRPLLDRLPEGLRWEWQEIIGAHGQAQVQLESCRNRMKPFFDCFALKNMFSSTVNLFDVPRWMAEKKIVLLNLAPLGRLPETAADMIGGFTVNEIFSVARSLPPELRQETLVVLDEFQRFVRGSDLEFALAESRQLKTRLLLSHQSFSQLKTDSVDLTSLILQAQTRLMLKVAGFDAEVLAAELAGVTFDPRRVKDEIWHRQQRISGHRVIELHSRSGSEQMAENWNENHGTGWKKQQSLTRPDKDLQDRVRSFSDGSAGQSSRGKGGSKARTEAQGTHEALIPEYEEFVQLASRNYFTFDENKNEWGRVLRELQRGQGLLQIADVAGIHEIDIKRTAPGQLALPWETILKRLPHVAEAYYRLLEANYAQDCFISPAQVERETQQRLEYVLRPIIDGGSDRPHQAAAGLPQETNGGSAAEPKDDGPTLL